MLSTYAVLMSESWRGPAIMLHSEHLGCYFNWKNLTVLRWMLSTDCGSGPGLNYKWPARERLNYLMSRPNANSEI